MRASRVVKTELIVLACVAALWAVNLKTSCVPRVTAGALRQVVKVAPNSQSAYRLLGRVYHSMDRRGEAVEAFTRAYAISVKKHAAAHPDDAEAHLTLGRDYQFGGEANIELAIAEYRTAVRLNPNLAVAWLFLGVAYEQQDRHAEAMRALREAVHVDPAPPACRCLANVSRRVVETDPENAEAHFALGLAHYQLRELEPAITAFERVISLDPGRREAYEWLASCYWETGQREGSIATWKRAAEANPQWTWPHVRLAFDYTDMTRHEEAIAEWEEVIARQPDASGFHVSLGNTCMNAGDRARALSAYRKAVSLDQGNKQAHFCLGKAYLDTGQPDLASQEQAVLRGLDSELADELLRLIRAGGGN